MTPPRANWKLPSLGVAAIGAAAALPLLLGAGDVASAQPGQLQRFSSCTDLKAFAREATIRAMRSRQTVYAVEDMAGAAGAPLASSAGGAKDAAARAATPEAGTDYSTTNVQIPGVDEPDIVKTDGRMLYALAHTRLYAVDVTGDAPRVVGSLDVGVSPREMLLTGGGLIVIGSAAVPFARSVVPPTGGMEDSATLPAPAPDPSDTTTIIKVEIADPAAMRVAERFGTDADYVSARMSDGTIRVVLQSNRPPIPAIETTVPGALSDAAYVAELDKQPAESWLPSYHVDGPDGERTNPAPITPCESVSRTIGADTGTSTLTVLTIDPGAGLEPVDRDTVMGAGSQVMMSGDNLYVTTTSYADAGTGPDERTDIHMFDVSRPTVTDYRASGSVAGTLLNQFAMDEHDGVLRVATTRSHAGGPAIMDGRSFIGGPGSSDSAVTTLRVDGRRLVTMGEVAGLGKGERIYSVRFMGDRGYVVTFRQTDPLYTVDLSDASHPRVTGELKIPGYSAYLHPIGENLVLGVGQDATGVGQRTGTQVSLFDTSDPARPRQVDKWTAPGTGTQAEWDHHAFLWWAPRSMAVLPLTPQWTDTMPAQPADAVALRVTPDGIDGVRELAPPPGAPSVAATLRSVVVAGRLLSISDEGITSRSVDTLDGAAWTPLR